MSDQIPAAYRSKTKEQALAHLIEELAESIEAAAKSLRFGLRSVNPEAAPEEQETNRDWLYREIGNVHRAWAAFVELEKVRPGQKVGIGPVSDAAFQRNISTP